MLPFLFSSSPPYTLLSHQALYTPPTSSSSASASPAVEQMKVSLILERQLPANPPPSSSSPLTFDGWASSSLSSAASLPTPLPMSAPPVNEWEDEEAALEATKRELSLSIQLLLKDHQLRLRERRMQAALQTAAAAAALDTCRTKVDGATQTDAPPAATTPVTSPTLALPSLPIAPVTTAVPTTVASPPRLSPASPRSSSSSPRPLSSFVAASALSPFSSPFTQPPVSERAYLAQYADDEEVIRHGQQRQPSGTPPSQRVSSQPSRPPARRMDFSSSVMREDGVEERRGKEEEEEEETEEDEAAMRLEALRVSRERRRDDDARRRAEEEKQRLALARVEQEQARQREEEEGEQRAEQVRQAHLKAEAAAMQRRKEEEEEEEMKRRVQEAEARERRQRAELARLQREEEEEWEREEKRRAQVEAEERRAAELRARERQREREREDEEKRALLEEMKLRLAYRQRAQREEEAEEWKAEKERPAEVEKINVIAIEQTENREARVMEDREGEAKGWEMRPAKEREAEEAAPSIDPTVKARVERVHDDDEEEEDEKEELEEDLPTPTIEGGRSDEGDEVSKQSPPSAAPEEVVVEEVSSAAIAAAVDSASDRTPTAEDDEESQAENDHESKSTASPSPLTPPSPASPDLSDKVDAVTDGLVHDLTEDALQAIHHTGQQRRLREQQQLRQQQPKVAAAEAKEKEEEVNRIVSAPSTPPRRPSVPRLPLAVTPQRDEDEKQSEAELSGGTGTPKKSTATPPTQRSSPAEEETAALLSSLVSSWLNDSVGEWMSIQRSSHQRTLAQAEARLSASPPSTPPSSAGSARVSPSSPQSAAEEYTREFGLVEDKGILDVSVGSDGSGDSLSEDSWTNTSWRIDDSLSRRRGPHHPDYIDALLKEADAAIGSSHRPHWSSEDLLQLVRQRREAHPSTASPQPLLLHDTDHVAFHHLVLDLLIHHRTLQAKRTRSAQPWQRTIPTPPASSSAPHPLLALAAGTATAAGWAGAGLTGLPPGTAIGASTLQPLVHAVSEHARWMSRGGVAASGSGGVAVAVDEWQGEGYERAQADVIAGVADDLAQQLLDELTLQLEQMEAVQTARS